MKQHFDKLSALRELVLLVSSAPTTHELISTVLSQIVRIVNPDVIFFYRHQQGTLVLKDSWQSPGGTSAIAPKIHQVGQCLCGLAASGTPMYSKHIRKDPLCSLLECKAAGLHSFAALPLIWGNEMLGVLALGSFTERDFRRQANFLEILTGHISVALQTALSRDEVQKRTAVLDERVRELEDTKKALSESKSHFQMLYESAPLPYQSLDSDGYLVEVNQAWLDALGYGREEVLGRWMGDFLTPAMSDLFKERFPCFKEAGEIHGSEFDMLRKDGSIITVSVEGRIGYDSRGIFEQTHCVLNDITEYKRAQAAILRERDFSITALNSLPGIMYLFNHEGNFMRWNSNLEHVTGYTAEEIGEMSPLDMFDDQDRVKVAKRIQEVFSTGTADVEADLVSKSGRRTHYYLTGRMIEIEGRVCLIGMGIDVSELKRTQEALFYAEKKFRDLLEAIQLVAVMLDCEGNITFCNNYLLDLTGRSRDEVLGKNWFEIFIPREVRSTVRSVFTAAVSQGNLIRHYENSIMTREGNLRLIVWDNTILYNPEGTVKGIASIGVDVTEHRKVEEQLRQSQKLEAIGELAGGVAHDFNNILSAIVGYAHLTLIKLPKDDPLRENLDEVLRASDRAVTLTQSLLSFSRKQVIDPRAVNLNAIVAKHEKLLARLIREDIEISVTCTKDELMIFADSRQIEQILMNLVTNARDAMPRGGRIMIRTERASLDQRSIAAQGYGEEGEYALLSVSDTGQGMDAKTKEKVFEPFFTTKEQGKGTGLGLSMVYGIVKQHSGHIVVYSEPGQGTAFRIYLPLVKGTEGEELRTSEAVASKGGTETILIAEDDDGLRKLTSTILSHHGYRVIEAVDGQDAVAKFVENRERISLIILDGIMPKKNGREVYEEIRTITPVIKAIFLSGYAEDVISKQGVFDPGINFILKPVSPKALLQRVRQVLDS